MAFKCDRDLFFGKSKREYCRRTRSVKPVVAPQERGPGKACFLCQPCRKELGVKDKPKVKVIIRKSYPSDKAFKKAIRAFLDKHPWADELDIANGVRSGLRETCKAIDELVAAGMIEVMKK